MLCMLLAALLTAFAVYAVSEDENDEQGWLVLAKEANRNEDYETALRYYEVAAQEGNTTAQIMAAIFYYYGVGTEQSFEKAAEYYRLSADQNDPDALECLGYLYMNGLGVEQSTETALDLYRRAAALGSEEAQLQLEMYAE